MKPPLRLDMTPEQVKLFNEHATSIANGGPYPPICLTPEQQAAVEAHFGARAFSSRGGYSMSVGTSRAALVHQDPPEDTAARLARAEERLQAALRDTAMGPTARALEITLAEVAIINLRAKLAGPAPVWTDDGDWLGCSTGAAMHAFGGRMCVDADGRLWDGVGENLDSDGVALTRPEREALAEFMIARRRKWADDGPPSGD